LVVKKLGLAEIFDLPKDNKFIHSTSWAVTTFVQSKHWNRRTSGGKNTLGCHNYDRLKSLFNVLF
jgi:hypothetical protein